MPRTDYPASLHKIQETRDRFRQAASPYVTKLVKDLRVLLDLKDIACLTEAFALVGDH